MDKPDLAVLENRIGYAFKDLDTLKLALTHSSYANERGMGKGGYNERLEFLGDAALELVISRYIYNAFPQMPEGELTKLRASVVCESSLAKKAREIDLGSFLFLGKGEELTGGRNRESVLADAFEAVIGAVCIDGGLDAADQYVLNLMRDVIDTQKNNFRNFDYKTRLQETIQKWSKTPIQYVIAGEEGPDHGKMFLAKVLHDGNVLGGGSGRSKKEAEQNAAKAALEQMEL